MGFLNSITRLTYDYIKLNGFGFEFRNQNPKPNWFMPPPSPCQPETSSPNMVGSDRKEIQQDPGLYQPKPQTLLSIISSTKWNGGHGNMYKVNTDTINHQHPYRTLVCTLFECQCLLNYSKCKPNIKYQLHPCNLR